MVIDIDLLILNSLVKASILIIARSKRALHYDLFILFPDSENPFVIRSLY